MREPQHHLGVFARHREPEARVVVPVGVLTAAVGGRLRDLLLVEPIAGDEDLG